MRNSIFILISSLFLIAGFLMSRQLIIECKNYQTLRQEYADRFNYQNRFLDPDEWFSPEAAAEKIKEANTQQTIILDSLKAMRIRSAWTGGLIALYLIFVLYLYFRTKDARFLVTGLIIGALACLQVGLTAPMLEIAAFERDLDLGEIPIKTRVLGVSVDVHIEQQFPGDLYFYYQSKSVIELIRLLFTQRNYVVGISILTFSILFPLGKILLTLGSTWLPGLYRSRPVRFFVERAGKWSMADVFVVAVFLAYLAFDNMQVGINTQSHALVGLYFFFSYCLLSILSSHWLKAAAELQEAR